MSKKSTVTFNQIIEELLDNSKPFSPVYLHRFSDLHREDLVALKDAWKAVNTGRRVSLMEDLEDLNEADTLVCFDDISLMALEDDEPRVRSSAIRLMWETNDTTFWKRLIHILRNDPEEIVRASAASGLGLYIYMGEIEEIPQDQFKEIEKALLDTIKSKEKSLVRQKSLEGLGFSSHDAVPDLIRNAYDSAETDWKISALFAMGRSADDQRWKEPVIKSLRDSEPEIRFEAVKAAGELGLNAARQPLMEMLVKPENREEDELRQAIIWSLSQIGGERVREVLSALLDQAEDEEEEEFISDALENLSLTEGMDLFGMLEVDLEDEELPEDGDGQKPSSRKRHRHTSHPASNEDAEELTDEVNREIDELILSDRRHYSSRFLENFDEEDYFGDEELSEDEDGDDDFNEDRGYEDEDEV